MMKIQEIPISAIVPYENNPRKNESAVESVARSISEYGFKVPVILDKDNIIISGHTRVKAAESLKMEKVPCIIAEDLTEEQTKALRLADNKAAQLSTWNIDKLEKELDDLDGADWVIDLFRKAEKNGRSNENFEIEIDDFSNEVFAYECPCCGFRFN